MLGSWGARAAVMISLVMVVATLFFVGFLTRPESEGPSIPNGPQPTSTTEAGSRLVICVVGATTTTVPGWTDSDCPPYR